MSEGDGEQLFWTDDEGRNVEATILYNDPACLSNPSVKTKIDHALETLREANPDG